VTGTVSNRGTGGGRYAVSLGGGRAANVSATTGAYTANVVPGTYDLVVTHAPSTGTGGGGDSIVDQVFVQRGLVVSAAMTADVDFSKAVAPQTFPVTVTVTGTPNVTTTTTLYAGGGTTTSLVRDSNTPFETNALDSTQAAGTDVYDQSITVAGASDTATVSNATSTPAAQTFVAPAAVGGALATVAAATPYPQIKTTWTAYPSAVGYRVTGTQALTGTPCGAGVAACAVNWNATLSAAWLGTAAEYQMPDLSALTGWNAAFQPVTGTMVSGGVEASTSSAGASDFPFGRPVAGTQRTRSTARFAVTP
jgi:hypothetical protein